MPKIPQFQSTRNLPGESGLAPINPQAFSAEYGAIARAGEQLQETGLKAANAFDMLVQRETKALRETKTMEIGEALDNDFGILKEKVALHKDPEKIQADMAIETQALREKYRSQLTINDTPDRELSVMYEKIFSNRLHSFNNEVRMKKLTMITERGQMAFMNEMRNDLSAYALETNANKQILKKNDFEIKARQLVGSLFTAEQVNGFINSFEANALKEKQRQITEAKSILRQRATYDPDNVYLEILEGKHDGLLQSQDAKADIMELALRGSEAKRKEKDQATNKAVKSESERIYAGLMEKVRKGNNIVNEVYMKGPNGDRTLIKEHYDQLLDHADAIAKAGPVSDPDILMDVRIKANAAVPRIKESEINNYMRSGKLSGNDGEKALDQIRTTNRLLRDDTKQANNQRYHDAEKWVSRGLGIPGGMIIELMEKLDPVQKGMLERAMNELWNRSIDRGGKEDPMAVAKEITPVYKKALTGESLLSIKKYDKLIEIHKYPTKEKLAEAFEKKQITKEEFIRKTNFFKERKEQQDIIDMTKELSPEKPLR